MTERGRALKVLAVGGIGGWATIRGLRETEDQGVGERDIELALDVRADGVHYTVTHRQRISANVVDDLHLGTVLPVEIDPGDPNQLVIR